MNTVVPLQRQPYDLMLHQKNPFALRLNDSHHQRVQVGDLVQFSGHNSIMDRQKFSVIGKMSHPTVHDAVRSIQGSNLHARDKIRMTNAFIGLHGPEAAHKEVVSLHLAPHPNPGGYIRSVGSLGR